MSATEDDRLKAADLAWQRIAPSERGPRRTLSVSAIVEAAVELADEAGVDGLSMSALARRFGTGPMTLYRYIPSKSVLVLLAADHAQGRLAVSPSAGDWRDDLRAWCVALGEAYSAHPWLLDVPITGAPLLPNETANLETALEAIANAELDVSRALMAIRMVAAFVRSDAEQRRSLRTEKYGMASYARALKGFLDADAFPHLSTILRGSALETDDFDEEFAPGLELLLDGIARSPGLRRPPTADR